MSKIFFSCSSPFAPDDDFAIHIFSLRVLEKAIRLFLSSVYFACNFFLVSDLDFNCSGRMIKETGIH